MAPRADSIAAAESGPQERRKNRRRTDEGPGRTGRTGAAFVPIVRAFPKQWAVAAKRIQPASNGSPRTRIAGDERKTSPKMPSRTGPRTSAGCCWKSRRRRGIEVEEELDYHVVAEDVPCGRVAEIENHADRYPGAKIVKTFAGRILKEPWPPTCSDILVPQRKRRGTLGQTIICGPREGNNVC